MEETRQQNNYDLLDSIEEALQNQSAKEALKLINQLKDQKRSGGLEPTLQEKFQQLRVIALPLLPASDLISLFLSNLRPVLDFNVSDRLRTRLVSLPTDEQDKLKQDILNALKSNNQEIITGPINTPAKWMEAYKQAHLSVDEFVKQSDIFQQLSVEVQIKIQRLLQLVHHVELSSGSPEGVEDEVLVRDETGRFRVLRAGEFIDLGLDQTQSVQPAIDKKPIPKQAEPLPKQSARPAIAPPPPAIQRPISQFYFNSDDEEEVKKHRTRLAQIDVPVGTNLDGIVNNLITDFSLVFPDENVKGRFASIIKSRLRDVRDLIETENMLCRSAEVGGVGLDSAKVKAILSQVEEESLKIHQARSVESTTVAPVETPQQEPTPVQPKPEPEKPPAPSEPEPRPAEPDKLQPQPIPVKKITPIQTPEQPKKQIKPKPIRTIIKRPIEPIRPTVSDIKPPKKMIGPVEELSELTLKDYRALGENTEESNEKIMEKLDLLEEDSYLRRAEGVKAWKNSDVYKLYLSIGLESMEKDMAVIDVVRQRKADGRQYLTQEEFQAVADLNKKISF